MNFQAPAVSERIEKLLYKPRRCDIIFAIRDIMKCCSADGSASGEQRFFCPYSGSALVNYRYISRSLTRNRDSRSQITADFIRMTIRLQASNSESSFKRMTRGKPRVDMLFEPIRHAYVRMYTNIRTRMMNHCSR